MATLDRIPEGQLETVALADGDLRVVFVPGAGMIGCSLEHRGEELLVQRGGLDAWRGTGRSFGLPLLHPWANRLRDWRYAAAGRAVTIDRSRGIVRADETDLPIHGALAAAEDWDLVDAGADGDSAWLAATLDYGRRDDRLSVFPFPHLLELELRLAGDTLDDHDDRRRARRGRAARVRLASVAVATRRAAGRVGAGAAGTCRGRTRRPQAADG